MISRDELHVVFGTGPVGLAVMRELHGQGKRVRLVNRSGTATAPEGVEVVKGECCRPRQHTPGVPGCNRRLQLCQRALYRLGCAFASHAGRHYPGRGGGQCEAGRGRESLYVRPGLRSHHRNASLPPHHPQGAGARTDGRGSDGGSSRGDRASHFRARLRLLRTWSWPARHLWRPRHPAPAGWQDRVGAGQAGCAPYLYLCQRFRERAGAAWRA